MPDKPPVRRRTRATTRRSPTREPASTGIADALAAHLKPMRAPYLFVGAGLSIRYANAEGWADLLARYCAPTGKPYEYYASTADGSLPRVASLLAERFHEVWWEDERYADARASSKEIAVSRESALKIEISRHLASAIDNLPDGGPLARELDLLRAAKIDGIITTNFDGVLEHVRPDLVPFVGQDELLFSDAQGIGEIYKIHGSYTEPNSLVLTEDDYQVYAARNPYLAAKLLTIFVEHPVVFLGYSLGDENVQQVLVDIATCLTEERLEALRDRLVFVEWKKGATPSMTSTFVQVDGYVIPVQRVVVPDFLEVFAVLIQLKRQIPARLLRHLRKEVHELVTTSASTDRLYVEELDEDVDPSGVQVYAGVGAITRLVTSYVGLNRRDLFEDILDDRGYDASRVVLEALPRIDTADRTQLPVYKYLRGSGNLDARGEPGDPSALPKKVLTRVQNRDQLLTGLKQYAKRAERALSTVTTFGDLVATEDPDGVIYCVPFLAHGRIDPDELRDFLIANRQAFDERRQPLESQWARAVCIYDWITYGQRA